MKRLLILTLFIITQFNQTAFGSAEREPQTYALVIGISEYQQPSLGKLKYAQSDAIAFSNFLKSPAAGNVPEENIVILPPSQATRRQILKSAEELFKKRATSGDMIIFYFSGHGISETGDGYLMPYEGEKEDALGTGVPMDQIYRIINSSPAKMKSVYIDACHAGLFPKKSGTKSLATENNAATALVFSTLFKQAAPGMMAVLSSRGNEESMEAPGLKQGLFTYFLIKGLEGDADREPSDGIITAGELEDYLSKEVNSYSGYAQHPLVTGTFNEKFPLSVKNTNIALGNLASLVKSMNNQVVPDPAVPTPSPRPAAELLSDGMTFDGKWAYGQATFINKLGFYVVMYSVRGNANLIDRDVMLADGEQLKTTRLLISRPAKLEDCHDLFANYTFCFRIIENGVTKYAFIDRLIEVGKNIYFELTPKNTIFSPGNGY